MDSVDIEICNALARLTGLPLAAVMRQYLAGKNATYTPKDKVYIP